MHSIQPNRRPSRVPANREANAIATLTLAFSSDPANRWCWPETSEYLSSFPEFVRGLGGNAFATECAYEIANGAGVALWLPPGTGPDEAQLMDTLERRVHASRRRAVFEIINQMDSYHPKTAHWYLAFVGVEPLQQCRGLGAQLLRPVLNRCDEDRLPAYLESSNPRNIPFYESLGFRRIGMIQAGTSPEIVPMLREPQ